ncbi:MAG: pyrroloquinoline quinone-dependent dehydrogenase [Acidobacteria bacterium]|nr:pyrroloquinoline quinone-dependent dehydrogenase [Acidobacteriota bacterium]
MYFLLVWLALAPAWAQEWRTFSGDPAGSRYSPLKQIDRSNVAKLRPAWIYHSGDKGDRGRTTIQCTPVVIGGVMYVTSPMLKTIALDAATGREIWRFDPFEGSEQGSRGVSRGVTYWADRDDRRILFGAGPYLYELDARTGKSIAAFGDNGRVDLRQGLDREPPGSFNGMTTPGAIYKNLIIVGASVGEGPRLSAPGHIRAYHVRTGKREWIFHTIPHPGEFGHETWEGDAWKTAGAANNWGGMSVDEKRGWVFVSTGSPAFDFYGGQRLGANLFGNSVLALDAATGKRIWHFQTTHHDLWDYDLPTLPNLVRVQGRDAVVQVTKTGMAFVLDRETGKPLFPVEERPAPASSVPGERSSPTQPFTVKPPPFVPHRFEPTDISPEARAYVMERLKTARAGEIYTPPSLEGTVILPGFHGGALWGGSAFDPDSGRLYLNANNVPWLMTLVKAREGAPYPYDHLGYKKFEDAEGYPAVKPPWGKLVSIDLNEGRILWQRPLGELKELTRRGVPPTGTENIGGAIVTAGGLVFIGATKDEMFRAFDADTGKLLWETKLEAGAYAVPATYSLNGRQFVVIAAGGGGKLATPTGDAFVAFALP